MPSLRELQARFAADLLGDAPAGEGIAAYRRNARANYRNALRATYPVVAALAGGAFFDAAVDAYVAFDPPRSGDLNVYGATFARFLEGHGPARVLPYLPDVARLEWALDAATRAADAALEPDAVMARLQALGAESAAHARLALHPSCRRLACAYPAFEIWRFHQLPEGEARPPAVERAAQRLLVRREGERVLAEKLDPAEDAWLAAIERSATLEASAEAALACDGAFDLAAALRRRIADGTIAGIDERMSSP